MSNLLAKKKMQKALDKQYKMMQNARRSYIKNASMPSLSYKTGKQAGENWLSSSKLERRRARLNAARLPYRWRICLWSESRTSTEAAVAS